MIQRAPASHDAGLREEVLHFLVACPTCSIPILKLYLLMKVCSRVQPHQQGLVHLVTHLVVGAQSSDRASHASYLSNLCPLCPCYQGTVRALISAACLPFGSAPRSTYLIQHNTASTRKTRAHTKPPAHIDTVARTGSLYNIVEYE
jgi:hypothetical protein